MRAIEATGATGATKENEATEATGATEAIETTKQQGEASQGMAGALLWPAVRRKMEKLDPSFMN